MEMIRWSREEFPAVLVTRMRKRKSEAAPLTSFPQMYILPTELYMFWTGKMEQPGFSKVLILYKLLRETIVKAYDSFWCKTSSS